MEHAVAVPKAERKSAENENFPIAAKSNESDQSADNQQLMSLEIKTETEKVRNFLEARISAALV